jgi:hypothetical protein
MNETLAVAADRNADSNVSGLSGLKFSKGHGTGNDFVLLADPNGTLSVTPEQVAALCDRHRGLGGDGLIRAVPSRLLPEGEELLTEHPEAEWFMDYRNGDGSLSEMCGNGVRVFVHFLIAEGLVDLPAGGSLTIGTRAGVKTVVRTAAGYAVDMGPWAFIFPGEATARAMDSLVSAEGLAVARPALSVSMGNPHTVVAPSLRPPSCSPHPWLTPPRRTAPTSSSSSPPSPWSTTASEPSPCAFTKGERGKHSPAAPVPVPPPSPSATGPARARPTPGASMCPAVSWA